ncbi:MAG: hypothetical protein QG589_462 [Patescibacteria group bacterium]|nr:hypothetical protein [Patescibacteria group bacterium]
MKKVIYAAMSFAPVLALAQSGGGGLTQTISSFSGIPAILKNIVTGLIPVLFALAILYFFWGLIEYIRAAGDPKKASEGKSIMIYGLVAIFIMATLFGIISWLQGSLGVSSGGGFTTPTIN